VVKLWFLDAAATSNGGDYAATVLGIESELTITEFIPNDDDEPQETGGLLKRSPYPVLAKQVVQQLEKMNGQPPEGISDSSRSRAVQALEEYSPEAARPPKRSIREGALSLTPDSPRLALVQRCQGKNVPVEASWGKPFGTLVFAKSVYRVSMKWANLSGSYYCS
jgi:hypothetical protein